MTDITTLAFADKFDTAMKRASDEKAGLNVAIDMEKLVRNSRTIPVLGQLAVEQENAFAVFLYGVTCGLLAGLIVGAEEARAEAREAV